MKTCFLIAAVALAICAATSAFAQDQEMAKSSPDGKPFHRTHFTSSLPTVVDSTGKVVGPVVGPWPSTPSGQANLVFIKVNGVDLEIPAAQSGFLDNATSSDNSLYGSYTQYYVSTDCSGSALLSVSSGDGLNNLNPGNVEPGLFPLVESSIYPPSSSFPSAGPLIFNGILYYAAAPFTTVEVGSSESSNFGGGNPTNLGSCVTAAGPSSIIAGTLTTVSVSSLGFTPPFSAQ
jgi:hypothetical protein